MAKLIPWESLDPGMTVWEEWHFGTGSVRAFILRRVDERHLDIRYNSRTDIWAQTVRRSDEYRYWDSEPTLEEREETTWRG